MHFMNYRETIGCTIILTTACRGISAPTLEALLPPPSFHRPWCCHVGSLYVSFPFLWLGRGLVSVGSFVLKFYQLKSFYRVLQHQEGDPIRALHRGAARHAPRRWPRGPCQHRTSPTPLTAPGWVAQPQPPRWERAWLLHQERPQQLPWWGGSKSFPHFFSFLNMPAQRRYQLL